MTLKPQKRIHHQEVKLRKNSYSFKMSKECFGMLKSAKITSNSQSAMAKNHNFPMGTQAKKSILKSQDRKTQKTAKLSTL